MRWGQRKQSSSSSSSGDSERTAGDRVKQIAKATAKVGVIAVGSAAATSILSLTGVVVAANVIGDMPTANPNDPPVGFKSQKQADDFYKGIDMLNEVSRKLEKAP
jgi:hypothetical protein